MVSLQIQYIEVGVAQKGLIGDGHLPALIQLKLVHHIQEGSQSHLLGVVWFVRHAGKYFSIDTEMELIQIEMLHNPRIFGIRACKCIAFHHAHNAQGRKC